uniref:glucose-6-phosphate 1-epimerase n=1 Tax=Chrysotila carterae TaxID=13221 RepID=A0A7S4B2N3_CHRCT
MSTSVLPSVNIVREHGPLTSEYGWTEPDELIRLTVPGASCTLTTYGATVVDWKNPYCERALWLSSLSAHGASGPIRGGVPIAFPQFAAQGQLPLHGFAREQTWTVVSISSAESKADTHAQVTLQLEANDVTRAAWPHEFVLRYTVRLEPTSLRLSLDIENVDTSSWDFTSCLHTYLRVQNIDAVSLRGLKGVTFTDKVDGCKEKVETNDLLRVPSASCESSPKGDGVEGFVDRIYHKPQETLVMEDEAASLTWTVKQSTSWTDTTVFNPWKYGKLGARGPDFDDDGYKLMLCIEPTVAAAPLLLKPGEKFTGTQLIQVKKRSQGS